jgi:hypothetical protein
MPPRTAGISNRDRFELNGKIGLDCTGRQDNSASGMPPVQHNVGSSVHLVKMTEKSLKRRKLQNPPAELYLCDLIRRLKSATD